MKNYRHLKILVQFIIEHWKNHQEPPLTDQKIYTSTTYSAILSSISIYACAGITDINSSRWVACAVVLARVCITSWFLYLKKRMNRNWQCFGKCLFSTLMILQCHPKHIFWQIPLVKKLQHLEVDPMLNFDNYFSVLTKQFSPKNPGAQVQVYPEVELSGLQVAPLLHGAASHVDCYREWL